MLKSRISLIALLLALGPVAAVAQETPAAPAEASPEAGSTPEAAVTPPAAAGEPQLNMGVEVGDDNNGEPKPGQVYTAATFEAWEQRCEKTTLSADPCQLYQLLKDGDGNAVAEFSMFSLPEGAQQGAAAGATFIAPLETLLNEGMRIAVDTNKARAYPFNVCSQIGCVARIGFTAEEVAMFKKGGNATFSITPFMAPTQKVDLKVSLKGFTAAYDAVTAANVAADAAAAAAAEAAKAAKPE